MSRPTRALPALVGLGVLVTLGVAPPAAAESERLAKCQALETEFDYKGMVRECALAAGEAGATVDERVTALRLMGFAHTTLGNKKAAREWFLRLLVLDPSHTLGPEVSPRIRKEFDAAAAKFQSDGKITVDHTAPTAEQALAGGALSVTFDVSDGLGRVSTARVVSEVLADGVTLPEASAPLAIGAGENGGKRLTGELADPALSAPEGIGDYVLRYRLVLENEAGTEVVADPAFAPVSLMRPGVAGAAAAAAGGSGGDEGMGGALLWGSVAVVGGVVAVGLVAGSVGLYCASGACFPRHAPRPIASVNVSISAVEATP
jgi:hypothetical protein